LEKICGKNNVKKDKIMTKTVLPRKIILVLFLYLVFIPRHDNVFSAIINCQPGAVRVCVCGFRWVGWVSGDGGGRTDDRAIIYTNDATTVILFNGSGAL